MSKVALPLAGLLMLSAAALLVPLAQANVPAAAPAAPGATSPVEKAAACVRQRVCGPRGCAWRTVCRRTPAPRAM